MSNPVVGTIFQYNETVPPYSQPGGPGTLTFPQQPIGEKMGLFTAACGHWFNNWLLQCAAVPVSSPGGYGEGGYGEGGFGSDVIITMVPSAIICCPLCSFVQQIITPFDLIYTPMYWYIIG